MFRQKIVNTLHLFVYLHGRKWARFSFKLFLRLLSMLLIYMYITKRVYKFARFIPKNFGEDNGQKSIARNIEWHAKENICTSLVEMQRKFLIYYVYLIHVVADWEI